MNAVELLLRERERRGLRMVFIITLGMSAVGILVNLLFLPDTPLKPYRYASWLVPIGGSLLALYLLSRRQMVVFTGFMFAAIVVAYTAFIPISNYLAVGPDEYPASALVLLVDYGTMELVITATALTLRPVYPLVVAGGISVTYAGLLAYALSDPRTQIAPDYGTYLTSATILPSREASILVWPDPHGANHRHQCLYCAAYGGVRGPAGALQPPSESIFLTEYCQAHIGGERGRARCWWTPAGCGGAFRRPGWLHDPECGYGTGTGSVAALKLPAPDGRSDLCQQRDPG